MKTLRLPFPLLSLATAVVLSLVCVPTVIAKPSAKPSAQICQHLPNIPAPQTASTLRLFTAYAMPTLVARFWTWQNEFDHIYAAQYPGQSTDQLLREFTRTTRPYQWEITLLWKLSLPGNHTTTPLTEAYAHHETRLREAYDLCKSLRPYHFPPKPDRNFSPDHGTPFLEAMLAELAEQRAAALLQIYVPEALAAAAQRAQPHPHNHLLATGEIP